MLDAYSIRKAVPRILIAAIGINLSIYLCMGAIEIVNVVGRGLGQLITEPFLREDTFGSIGVQFNAENNIAGTGLVLTAIAGVGGLVFAPSLVAGAGLALLGALVPFVITAALISLAILFTLVIRQGLLIFLVIVSPVAIALFVLPGTEKYFKKWWDLFIKTLLVYPIIVAMFAISTALAAILLGTAGDSPDGIGLAKLLAAIVVIFAPLVLIPFAFKLAGGAISAIMNVATGQSANLAGRASKKYQALRQDPNNFIGNLERNRRKTLTDQRASLYNRSVGRSGVRGRIGRIAGSRYSAAKQSMENAESAKYISGIAETGNDTYIRAATIDMESLQGTSRHRVNSNGQNEYMAATGQWFSESEVKQGQRLYSSQGDMQAAYKLVLSKTEQLPPENQQMVLGDYLAYANRQNLTQGEAAGGWAGIAIPNQRIRQDIRYAGMTTNDSTGRLEAVSGHSSLLDSLGTQQGFTMASQQEGTFEAAVDAYKFQRTEYDQAGSRIENLRREAASATSTQDRDRIEHQITSTEAERAKIADRMHNFKGNLRKFVGSTPGGSAPPPIAAPDSEGNIQPGAAYGGASSASFKSEQAARLALSQIEEFDTRPRNTGQGTAPISSTPPPQGRPFSGGRGNDIPNDRNPAK